MQPVSGLRQTAAGRILRRFAIENDLYLKSTATISILYIKVCIELYSDMVRDYYAGLKDTE